MDGYRERLVAAPAYWAAVPLAAVLAGAVLLPVATWAAALLAAAVASAVVVALLRAGAVVEVADGVLRAGAARLPLRVVTAVDVLDAAATRAALGPELDARAYTCTRPWVRTAVRIHLADPQDPAPYWLVSTRNPTLLAAHVARAGPGQPAHSEQTS